MRKDDTAVPVPPPPSMRHQFKVNGVAEHRHRHGVAKVFSSPCNFPGSIGAVSDPQCSEVGRRSIYSSRCACPCVSSVNLLLLHMLELVREMAAESDKTLWLQPRRWWWQECKTLTGRVRKPGQPCLHCTQPSRVWCMSPSCELMRSEWGAKRNISN